VTDTDEPTPETSRKRWIKRVVLGGIAAVVLFFAGIFVCASSSSCSSSNGPELSHQARHGMTVQTTG